MSQRLSLIGSAIAAVILCPSADAQVPPDAGLVQQSIERQPMQLPAPQSLDLALPDTPAEPSHEGGPALQVSGFAFEGNTAIATAELQALLADLPGRQLSLGELRAAAARITQLYRERGYALARAYLPAQTIENGVVTIAVLEGRYGSIEVDSTANVRGAALAPLARLQPGEVVRAESLEQALLLLQDTPGLQVKGVLSPGAAVGTSDLQVQLQPGQRLTGMIGLDNHGNRYTGEYRLNGHVAFNNPLGLGDQLSLRLLGSNERQLYGRVAYQLPVGPWATQVGAAYSDMDYELGRNFEALDATGRARIASVFALQPLLRTRDASLYLQLQYEDKRLRDEIRLFSTLSKKHSQVASITLSGNASDGWLGGAMSAFSLGWSRGDLNIKDAAERTLDAATARTEGQFHKLNASVVRLQQLAGPWSLYAQAQGQLANGNLDSSEKMTLGGANGVRAYPQGEAAGDEGWLGSVELRYSLNTYWQLAGFVDHGQVRMNKRPWQAGRNHRSLSGAGVGINWSQGGWSARTALAWRLGNAEAESAKRRSPQLWLTAMRAF